MQRCRSFTPSHPANRGVIGAGQHSRMATAAGALALGTRRADRHMLDVGSEFRERRIQLGSSQAHVAGAARISRIRYGRIERGRLPATILELDRIAAALGLELSVRVYPGGSAVRDAGQASRLSRFLALARPPLRYRVEVALPRRGDRPEPRAWDAMLYGHDARTAIEFEGQLRDVQSVRRRHELKRRDDPTESFLMLVADTRANRTVLAEFPELFADLPRLKPATVSAALAAGVLPPTGLLLI